MEWQLQESIFTASRERGTAAMPPLRRGAPPAHNRSSRLIRPPKSDSGRLKLSAREPTATRAEKRPVVNQGGAGNDRGRTTRREELRGSCRRTCGGCQEFCSQPHVWPQQGVSVFLGSVRCYPLDETGGCQPPFQPISGRGHTLPGNLPQHTTTLGR